MKRKILISALILILAVIGAGGYWLISNQIMAKKETATADKHDHKEGEEGDVFYTCPMHPTVVQDKPGDCPICGMKLEKRTRSAATTTEETVATEGGEHAHGGKEFYTCPMHPTVIQDKPGDCPICGMKLEKKVGGAAAATVESPEEIGTVQLSPVMVQTIGVKSEEVKTHKLIKEIRTAGRIDYNEKAIKMISARVPGRIDKLFVDFTGVKVKKGEPLVLLYSPELVSAQQEYLIAMAALEKIHETPIHELHKHAQTLVDASRQRLQLWGITDQQVKELEDKKNNSIHLTIYSPISGIVTQKNVVEGMYVSEGSPLYTIVDLSTVWMYAEVYEYELSWVKAGQEVEMGLPAYPGKKFRGKVTFIDPILNPNTRTVRVRAEIKNQDSLLKPGMFADAFLQAVVGESVVAVPESAVIHSGERNVVLLDRGNGKFTPREVEMGTLAKGYYQILSGVSSGDWVVTSANFLIDSESNLRTAVAKMTEK